MELSIQQLQKNLTTFMQTGSTCHCVTPVGMKNFFMPMNSFWLEYAIHVLAVGWILIMYEMYYFKKNSYHHVFSFSVCFQLDSVFPLCVCF